MCGRTACGKSPDEICNICSQNIYKGNSTFQREVIDGEYHESYNKAPQSYNPILLSSSFVNKNAKNDLTILPMYWTLIPSWFKGGNEHFRYKTINCRKEGILNKTMFKGALQKNYRCVILADGYYEWQKVTGQSTKQPYFFYFPECSMIKNEMGGTHSPSNDWIWTCPRLITIAGIFDIHHKEPGSKPLYSYSIMTVAAHSTVSWIHERMPAILDGKEEVKKWLNPNVSSEEALELIRPFPNLNWHPVSTAVNNVRNQGIELIYPITVSENASPSKKSKYLAEVGKNDAKITQFFGTAEVEPAIDEKMVSIKSEVGSNACNTSDGLGDEIQKVKKYGKKDASGQMSKRKRASPRVKEEAGIKKKKRG